MAGKSPEALLLDAAASIAFNAPETHGPTTTHTLVYWPTVERLREALDALGIDWRKGSR
jgi:hypothetical protein